MRTLLILCLLIPSLTFASTVQDSKVKPDPSKGSGGKHGTFKDESIDVNGKDRNYRLEVPKSVNLKSPVPLLFVFHGMGGNMSRTAAQTRFGTKASKEKFILCYPNAISGMWSMPTGGGGKDADFFDALFKHIASKYNIDRNRVFVTGFSLGGYFSNFIGTERSEVIAAIAPHSGGTGGRTLKAKRKLPVFIIHGDADDVVNVKEGRSSRDMYKKQGHEVKYLEISGLKHKWAHGEKINDQIWKFFLDHPRKKKKR